MPISTLDPQSLRKLTPQQIADMVLSLDQHRRYYERQGLKDAAAECADEIDRLAALFQACYA